MLKKALICTSLICFIASGMDPERQPAFDHSPPLGPLILYESDLDTQALFPTSEPETSLKIPSLPIPRQPESKEKIADRNKRNAVIMREAKKFMGSSRIEKKRSPQKRSDSEQTSEKIRKSASEFTLIKGELKPYQKHNPNIKKNSK